MVVFFMIKYTSIEVTCITCLCFFISISYGKLPSKSEFSELCKLNDRIESAQTLNNWLSSESEQSIHDWTIGMSWYTSGLHWTPLHSAAFNGHTQIIQIILDYFKKYNISIDHLSVGLTALQLAVSQGHYEAVHLLISNGANVSVVSPSGITPFATALSNNYIDIANLLADHEVDPPTLFHEQQNHQELDYLVQPLKNMKLF